jgi:hypothetical protein
METSKAENVRINYDIQLEPEIFDLLLKNDIAPAFAFSSEQYIPFSENETIFLQIGGDWFDARITKIKKGIEIKNATSKTDSTSGQSQISILIDAVLLDRDRLQEYFTLKKRKK